MRSITSYAKPIILSVSLAFAGGLFGSYLTDGLIRHSRLREAAEYLNLPQVQEERRKSIISLMRSIGVNAHYVGQDGQEVPVALDDLLPK